MIDNEIMDWIKQEFQPVTLATPDTTIRQMIQNAKRYWNTHSAYPIVKMFDAGAGQTSVQLSNDYKGVHKVYPSTVPDWILSNFPMWSLLGITIIDNMTSDLIMLGEAYRNYRYYIGTDFHYHYEKSDNPNVGPVLYTSNLPAGTMKICVVGTKRLQNGTLTSETLIGNDGTLTNYPVDIGTLVISNDSQTYTDDGTGALVSSVSGYSGTINHATGEWTVTGWVDSTPITAEYKYSEDITSEHILLWVQYYAKALIKQAEGNTLRKADAIDIKNDGDRLFQEGTAEKKELEDKLALEGRWIAFVKRY